MTYDAAPGLKEEFDQVGITPDQMNVIHKAMRAAKKYHSMAQIAELWRLSCPDNIEVKNIEREGKFGKFIGLNAVQKLEVS